MEKQLLTVTMKSFCPLFSKSGRGQGDKVPLWDFKGQSPLTDKNSKQNLRMQILTINYFMFNRRKGEILRNKTSMMMKSFSTNIPK